VPNLSNAWATSKNIEEQNCFSSSVFYMKVVILCIWYIVE